MTLAKPEWIRKYEWDSKVFDTERGVRNNIYTPPPLQKCIKKINVYLTHKTSSGLCAEKLM